MRTRWSIFLLIILGACQTYQPIEIFPSLSAPMEDRTGKRWVQPIPPQKPLESANAMPTQQGGPANPAAGEVRSTPVSLTFILSEDGSYRSAQNVGIAVRDGILLRTDFYFPAQDGKYPVIVERTPFDRKAGRFAMERGPLLARAGFVYAVQSVRGQYDSEGIFNPFRNEGDDGRDLIQWIAAQPWFSGRLGSMGQGYGATAACLAAAGSPLVKALILENCPSDLFLNGGLYMDGVPMAACLYSEVLWRHQEYTELMEGLRWDDALFHLPLQEMDDVLGYPLPFWDACLLHPSYDYFWQSLSLDAHYPAIDAAVLHVGSWLNQQDLGGSVANYQAMVREDLKRSQSGRQALWMGPWSQGINSERYLGFSDFTEASRIDEPALYTGWFDRWLKDEQTHQELFENPVRLFLMGANEWTTFPSWPPPEPSFHPLFLHSTGEAGRIQGDGLLSLSPPEGFEDIDSFISDPLDPVLSELELGTDDQRPVENRADVLTFTSAPLENDLRVIGSPQAVIYASTTTPDTDLFVMLSDVDRYGFSRPVAFGVMRVRFRDSFETPSPVSAEEIHEYVIDLSPTANCFKKDHAIRISIMGSYFPFLTRNQNTGATIGQDSGLEKAVVFCLHDFDYPSRLVLPVWEAAGTSDPPAEESP